MKRVIVSLLCLSVGMVVANAQQQVPTDRTNAKLEIKNTEAGVFTFKEQTHDFGRVAEGPKIENDFDYHNSGSYAITISDVHSPCGCTVPSWSKAPVLPGEKGTIHVVFNTQGRVGTIDKTLTVSSDAQGSPAFLHLKGEVVAKGNVEEPATKRIQ